MESDLMRTYIIMLYYGFYMIFMAFRLLIIKILRKVRGNDIAESYKAKVVMKWSKYTLKVTGMSYKAFGKENIPDESCLFVANHQSLFDIPVLIDAAAKPLGFIAKKELKKVPILHSWTKEINCVYIDRENVREAIKSINEGIQFLQQGISMAIFPEGTRAKDGKIKAFKKGSLKLATKSGVPVVPVTIQGTYKAFELNKKLQDTEVLIHFGKPIYPQSLDKEKQNNLSEIVKEEIIKYLSDS